MLSDASDREEDIMDKAFDVKATSRLGCQSKIQSDATIVVEISRESRQAFLDEHPDIRAALEGRRRAAARASVLPRLDVLLARNLGWSRAAARDAIADGARPGGGRHRERSAARDRDDRSPTRRRRRRGGDLAVRHRARLAQQADRLRDRAPRPAPSDGL